MRGGGCRYAYDPTSASAPRSRFGRWVDRRLKSLVSLFERVVMSRWMMSSPVVLFGITCILGIMSVLFIEAKILGSATDTDRSYAEAERIAGRIRSFEREGHRFLYVNSIGKFGMLHDPDCPCGKR